MLPTAGKTTITVSNFALMSTNTMQFSAMDLSKTKASRAVRSHFSDITTYVRSILKEIEGVNITFIGGSQHRFTIPESGLRCCILQRNACKAMVVLKTIGTSELVSCRRVRKTQLKRSRRNEIALFLLYCSTEVQATRRTGVFSPRCTVQVVEYCARTLSMEAFML